MQTRHTTSPDQLRTFDTAQLRENYLVDDLFVPGEVTAVYTHHDRVVVAGAVPAGQRLTLPAYDDLRAEYFLENREVGIVNVGGPATVTTDGETHTLPHGACLYVGRGVREVVFEDTPQPAPAGDARSGAPGAATGGHGADGGDSAGHGGARLYLFSAPAHTTYPTRLVRRGEGTVRELGDQVTSNRRTLNQYIHPDGVRSCQVMMGVTELHAGSMWNTMPAHTHARRTECYLYFGVPADARVVHLLGEPTETRHLVVADEQAVISPSWSVHSGVGTSAYSFVWAMAGENQSFDDMDPAPVTALR